MGKPNALDCVQRGRGSNFGDFYAYVPPPYGQVAISFFCYIIWDKVFKSGLSTFCGRKPLKNLRRYGLSSTKFT